MKIARRFTKQGHDALNCVSYEKRTSRIANPVYDCVADALALWLTLARLIIRVGSQAEIDDCGREVGVTRQAQPVAQPMGGHHGRAGIAEILYDIQCNEGLVLDDQDRATRQLRTHVQPPPCTTLLRV